MNEAATELSAYRDAFETGAKSKREPAWLAEERAAALARFETLGFPTRRQELWRFTNLSALTGAAFPPAPRPSKETLPGELAPHLLAGAEHCIQLIDGYVIERLSKIGRLPAGAFAGSLARAVEAQPDLARAAFEVGDTAGAQPLAALNAALFGDGFVLSLPAGAVLEQPLQVVYAGGGGSHSFQARNLVALGENSEATLVETFIGAGTSWTNAVTQIQLAPGARLRHVVVQECGAEALQTALYRLTLARGAHYESFTLNLGARLSRQDVQVALTGESAVCALNGATFLRDAQESTMATFVDHAAQGCTTRETFKSVVDDRAHGVFLGKIAVRPGADKTDANQLNRNLLLSPRAAVDTKPELEILADDVKCSHGATVGDLDEAALFYLRSRGLDEIAARRMLIEAFAADALDLAGTGAIRELLGRRVQAWLEERGS